MNLNPNTELAKTSRRLTLLQAVADGAVYRVYPLGISADFDEWDHGPGADSIDYSAFPRRRERVTARIQELHAHGLLVLGSHLERLERNRKNWYYELTAAGERQLQRWGEAHREISP